MDRVDLDALKAVLRSEITIAAGHIGGQLSTDRRKAIDYYYGEPFGNEQDGRSQVVMTEVRDIIESTLPGLIEVFVSGERVTTYEPVGKEDEEHARQATDYINHVFLKENDGYKLLYSWFKDTLLGKVGFVKAWWDDTPEIKIEILSDLTEDEVVALGTDDEIDEILEHTEKEEQLEGQTVVLHDVKVRRKISRGRARIEGIPPEDFLISRQAKSIEESTYHGYKAKKTRADLLNMGFSEDDIRKFPKGDEQDFNEERVARFQFDEEWYDENNRDDWLMQEVWAYVSFIKIDYDNDGWPELRRIISDREAAVILENIEVDETEVVDCHAYPMPHKFFGLSLADFVTDLQLITSTAYRLWLDNIYLVNNARTVINDQVNLDDYLANRPGQAVRATGDVRGAVMPLVTESIGHHVQPLLESLASIREIRTGITRYNQGLDADSLNKTAAGLNMISQMAMKRQQLLARNMADGVRKLFRLMLRLTIAHQDREKVIRLRNNWVPFDPRTWNADMDVTVSVGLGHGTQEQRLAAISNVMATQLKAVELQGGAEGPLVTLSDVFNAARATVDWSGLHGPNQYFSDPTSKEMQEVSRAKQQKQSPEMMKLQLEAQKAADEAKARMYELQIEQKNVEARERSDAARHQIQLAELDLKRAELGLKAQESESGGQQSQAKVFNDMMLAREKAAHDIDIQRDKAEADIALKEDKAEVDVELKRKQANGDGQNADQ